MLVVFGILLPAQNGITWLTSPCCWPPGRGSVDARGRRGRRFVRGERERHTLETLLASRLPDEAISPAR